MTSELSPFSIDRKIINTLRSLIKEGDYLEYLLADGLINMNSKRIQFYIDENLSVTGKEIWLTVAREHLTAETVPNYNDWNRFPFTKPWENRTSPDQKLWLVRLRDGRFITAEYKNGWKRWPEDKVAYFRNPSDPPLDTSTLEGDFTSSNGWLLYPDIIPANLDTYEVFTSSGMIRTATWRGHSWSYFNKTIKAYKPINFEEVKE